MPALICSARNCVYNDSMYCSKGNIDVGGEHARVCQDTCCESFRERKGDSLKNSCGCASTTIDIHCEAVGCKYNEQCECHAGQVDIAGASACRCEETECVTFDGK